MVVDGGHGAELVESFDEHPFGIEIGKSERTDNVCHAPFFSPLLHRLDECGRYFEVVEEIDPSEADVLASPFFIGMAIDDSGYASYYLSVSVGEKVIGLTKLERRVFLFIEGIQHVVVKVGHRVRIILV